MKKVLSLILVLAMLLGMMPMNVFATEEAICDHTYKNGICTICGEDDTDGLDLNGLNVLCLGDSITYGQGLTTDTRWTNVLASKYDWNLTNKSQGGISLSSYYYTANGKSDVSIAKKAEVLKTMTTKPDVIIVWGGHNDTSYRASPLGTWADETTDSFKGALKHIAELANEYAPDATLFVLTPFLLNEKPSTLKVPANTSDNNWMFVDAIYDGAEAYGWIPINMDLCGITPFTKSGLLLDNIHPNEAGTEKIVEYLSTELASYGANSKKETIIFNQSSVSVKPGESTTLKGVLSPRSGTGTMTFTWSSSDSSVATVDANGKLTAVAPGNAIITATAANGTSAGVGVSVVCEHTYETTITAPTCTEQGYTTYTCDLCGVSYVDDYVDATSHNYENGTCAGCGAAQWDTDGDGVLEILAIGNSFSVDALEYVYQIAQNLGIKEIVLGNLYIGGCSLNTHATNAAGDLAKYTYYYNDNGTWKTSSNYKISTALESRSWDYVSLQQASNYSGVESSYNQDLTNLIAYVQERSDAKLVWHMTWAYQQNSTHSAFPTYNKDQMTMYNAIISAVQNKIATNSNFDLIVPNGTAVQNSRTSLLGDTTTRDGYHMSYDYGRYLTGLLFFKTVTGLSIDGITYAPSGVDAEEKAIAIESVNNAAVKPFAVTKSKYVNEVPEEGYILLQPELYKGAYWHPLKAGSYNKLIDDQSNSPDFFTTIRFTRETLPVGSIIVLKSGWQYRPDGWVTDTLQTGVRESATTKAFQIVTEDWWKQYTIRSFNISRTAGGSVMDLTEEEMRSIFRIYVPEEKHTHIYENGVCTLCGATRHEPFELYGANMDLGNKLDMNFYILKSDITDEGSYVVITKYNADGSTTTKTIEKKDWISQSDDLWKVTFEGIAAKEMADKIEVVVYDSAKNAISTVREDGVRAYCERMLDKETNDVKKALYVDMLNYGAASQLKFNYNTGDLANANIDAYQEYATELDGLNNNSNFDQVRAYYYGANMDLESSIKFNMYFLRSNVTADMKVTISFTDHTGAAQTMEGVLVEQSKDLWKVTLDKLVVADAEQVITCVIEDAEGNEVVTIVESMESYLARMTGSNELYEAIMKFGISANAYLHRNDT